MIGEPFDDGRAEASGACAVFDCNYRTPRAPYLVEYLLIERRGKDHVVVGGGYALHLGVGYGAGSFGGYRAYREECDIAAVAQLLAAPYGYRLPVGGRRLCVGGRSATRVAYGHGAFSLRKKGGGHEAAEGAGVARGRPLSCRGMLRR